MKILVFSDSHNNVSDMTEVISLCKSDTSLIVHLGDMVSDFRIVQNRFPDIPTISIKGNNDIFEVGSDNEALYNFESLRFFFTHGHKYNVKYGLDTLMYRAEELKCDVVLFGHTHVPFLKKIKNTLFVNPGSISRSTFAILNIKNGTILSSDICTYSKITKSIDFLRLF